MIRTCFFPGGVFARFARAVLFLVCVGLAAELPAGVTRTFTSRDGRTMEAELLGHRGDTLRVRRIDTNAEFTLFLSNLSTEDQAAVRELLEKHPELRDAIPADALRIETSTTKLTPKAKWEDIEQEIEAWAYDLTVTNLTSYPIPGLRVDYVIVGERGGASGAVRSGPGSVVRHKGSLKLENLPGRDRRKVRTEPLICVTRLVYRDVYVNGVVVTDTRKPVRRVKERSLKGLWFRVYDGDKLVVERSIPESLAAKEDWDAVDGEADALKRDVRFQSFFASPGA